MKGFLSSRAGQYSVLACVLVGAYLFFKKEAVTAVKAAGTAVNPVDSKNIFYKSVNAVGDVLNDGTQNDDFSLGSWWADVFPSDAEKKFNSTQTKSRG